MNTLLIGIIAGIGLMTAIVLLTIYNSPEPDLKVSENAFIVLNDEVLNQGDLLKANFTNPQNNEIFINVKCDEPTGWDILQLNSTQDWTSTPRWTDDVSICLPHCKNNSHGGAWCYGLCNQGSLGCKKLDNSRDYYSSISWDGRFREVRTDLCGADQGQFVFVDPAPAGTYKLQFQYFEDSECKIPKFAEKIFTVK